VICGEENAADAGYGKKERMVGFIRIKSKGRVDMGERLQGKTAIITGASAGIGWATAHLLAGEGCNIVVTARRVERLAKLVEELKAKGAKAVFVAGDAAVEATATEVVEIALDSFGKIDILINNAGIGVY
jgi:3-oxoacyl-[acyl-carrier protein] reductase